MPDRSAVAAQTSGTRTSAGTGSATRTPQGASELAVLVDVTALSGTLGPAMTLSVQWSHDGTTFATADPVDAFSTITATGRVVKTFAVKGEWFRLAWSFTGGSPSFTFASTAYGV